jgi:hypothetical protein
VGFCAIAGPSDCSRRSAFPVFAAVQSGETRGAPDGSDIGVTASAIIGLFPKMIELDLQISSATLAGVRTLFITTLNNDRAASTGMLEVR